MIPTFDLRNTPFKFEWSFDWRNRDVRRVLLLMLPVTISLGLINFNLLINSLFGSFVSEEAPGGDGQGLPHLPAAAGDLLGGVATVLFPTLARFAARGEMGNLRATMANGMRQILFVLVPAAAAVLVLSEPMIRLVYQRGEFTPEQTTLVATALFWFAFTLPTNGLYLLQTRTFFSLQRPWMATSLAGIDLVVSALGALFLYKPFGVGGIVAGTGHRHHRRGDRPGGDPAPRVRRPGAGPAVRHGDQDHDRRRGPGRCLVRRLGPSRQRSSGVASPVRSSRSASAWGSVA